ncbi:MAG: AraC family transcriptional regulator [Chitinophagaceae bacterium]|nr:AraC family transcriptional regulator [Chitinophagaceae bacterium]
MLTDVEFEEPDYVEYVRQFADVFKVRLTGNHLNISAHLGSGFIWAEKLPGGISVLIIHATLNQAFTFTQKAVSDNFYSLQFNEFGTVTAKGAPHKNRQTHQQQSTVCLTHTLTPCKYILPEGVLVKSVCIYFNKSQLSSLLGARAMEEMLTKYFPFLISNVSFEPIATDYRVSLNELLVDKIEVPLRLNFIQNRVLLLLEKFIINQFAKGDVTNTKMKRTDDETLRLMKVEALLVNNFAVAPPTIDELSRLSAMSPTKLKNDFKNMYRLPIYVYYQKNRMIKAKALVLTGKYSIKEVGVMVGYSNLSHFANTFKKEFGILPSEVSAKDGVLVYNS